MTFADELLRIKVCEPGESVYHYTDINGIYGLLSKNEFWATKSDFLNDKSEFNHILKIITSIITENCKHPKFADYVSNQIEETFDTIRAIWSTGFYVLSFSLNPDCILLWSEFSSFLGYNVEMDMNEIRGYLQHQGFLLNDGAVIYDEAEQRACLLESLVEAIALHTDKETFFNYTIENYDSKTTPMIVGLFALSAFTYSMFFKHSCFTAEEEYRLVIQTYLNQDYPTPITQILKPEIHYRTKNEFLIPYVKAPFEAASIKSIMVGPKNNIDLAKTGLEFYLKNQNQPIKVVTSDIPLRY